MRISEERGVDTLRNVKPEERQWLSISDVAKRLERSDNTIRTMIKKKQIPAYLIGGEYRIKEAEYHEWLERQKTAS